MYKYFFIFIGFLPAYVHATHIRAGEITARQLDGNILSYEFTLTVYTDQASQVENLSNTLFFGDGTFQDSNRLERKAIGSNTWVNIYKFRHTYSSTGSYVVYHFQRNRNTTISNISNPDDNTFYVETEIFIDGFLGANSTPVLLNPPIDVGDANQKFIHNPTAYDPDGDSLSYELVTPKQFFESDNVVIDVDDYRFPIEFGGQTEDQSGPTTFSLDPVTGNMVWNSPPLPGEYNVAFKIIEWRGGIEIGYVVRDMQIQIRNTLNRRPLITPPPDLCMVAGDSIIDLPISATDADLGDLITLEMIGEPFELNPENIRSTFDYNPEYQASPASGIFNWLTTCDMVRRLPYYITIKAEDDQALSGGVSLVDLYTWQITIVPPAPTLDSITAQVGSKTLHWKPYECPNADSIFIYRKAGPSDLDSSFCQFGIPQGIGFVKIGAVPASDTIFTDVDLFTAAGRQDCYRLTAYFGENKNLESRPSNEICVETDPVISLFTKASVELTDRSSGQIVLNWSPVTDIDTTIFQKPYGLEIQARPLGGEFTPIKQIEDLANDTSFIHADINTEETAWEYALLFSYTKNGNTLQDTLSKTQSVFLSGGYILDILGLVWGAETPWQNLGYYHKLYYLPEGTDEWLLYDSLLFRQNPSEERFRDNVQFEANTTVGFRIETVGSYGNPAIRDPIMNNSQEIVVIIQGSDPPCPLSLRIENDTCDNCDNIAENPIRVRRLKWESTQCPDDKSKIDKYIVYRSSLENPTKTKIYEGKETSLLDSIDLLGQYCYEVVAIDLSGNETVPAVFCREPCGIFWPNVISVNHDNINEVFMPECYPDYFTNEELVLFNRWGNTIARPSVEDLPRWDGKDRQGNYVSPGVYYVQFSADFVNARGEQDHYLYSNFIQVFR